MKKNLLEALGLIQILRNETVPLDGHPDPKAIQDCWNELTELISHKGGEEWYCTEPNCVIPNRCYHQGKPTLCGEELRPKKVCEYCGGKGYFINEDHPKYPKVQQKLDCYYCTPPTQRITFNSHRSTPQLSKMIVTIVKIATRF